MNLQKTLLATLAIAAFGAVGCQRNEPYARRQADSLDHSADRVEQRGKETAKSQADMLHEKAELIRDGIAYRVIKVDRAGQTVVLARVDKDAAKLDDKMMQAGRELTMTYGDLERYDVAHHRAGAEIAGKLHDDDKVTVFMDANGKVVKLDY